MAEVVKLSVFCAQIEALVCGCEETGVHAPVPDLDHLQRSFLDLCLPFSRVPGAEVALL